MPKGNGYSSPPATEILLRGVGGNNQVVGETSAWVSEMPQYARRIEIRTVGGVKTIYKAWAPLGSSEESPVWMIQRLVLDETTEFDVSDGIAGGEAGDFAYTWSDRTTHAYS